MIRNILLFAIFIMCLIISHNIEHIVSLLVAPR